MDGNLLEVKGLRTCFFTERGVAAAVDGVSFSLRPARIISIVGESGCGKSVTAYSIMRLIPSPPGRIVDGEILFEGRDLLKISEEEMRAVRGEQISMIFQEPMTSLNPVFRIDDQVLEAVQRRRKIPAKEAIERAVELLREVGIPSPEVRMKDYPHQMSGGMRQRVMIAMALASRPRLLIADEPTTALDVTIQAQILGLLQQLQETRQTAILLITHDLGVVAEVADHVLVMYAGRVVEEAPVFDLFKDPLHPYTQGLMKSIPGLSAGKGTRRLEAIPGMVPSLLALPAGCKFSTRCPRVFDRCRIDPEPPLLVPRGGHPVRCLLYEEK